MRRCYALVLALFIALASVGLVPAVARAGNEARFSLQPVTYDPAVPATKSYFVFDSWVGAVVESQVRITNTGTASGQVHLYAVDATTGQTSGTVFLAREAARAGSGKWVELGEQELTLQPGEERIVPFRVAVPSDARPGQHVAGLVAENATASTNAPTNASDKVAGFQLNVVNRTILAVQVNLPGAAVEQIDVTGVTAGGDSGYQQLLVGLRNSGTLLVQPSGTLVVKNAQGAEVQRLALKLNTILPGSAIAYPVNVERQALASGAYHATVELRYGKEGTTAHEQDFTITDAQIAQVFQAPAPLAAPSMAAPAGATPPQAANDGSPVAGIVRQALMFGLVLAFGSAGTLLIGRFARRGKRAE